MLTVSPTRRQIDGNFLQRCNVLSARNLFDDTENCAHAICELKNCRAKAADLRFGRRYAFVARNVAAAIAILRDERVKRRRIVGAAAATGDARHIDERLRHATIQNCKSTLVFSCFCFTASKRSPAADGTVYEAQSPSR